MTRRSARQIGTVGVAAALLVASGLPHAYAQQTYVSEAGAASASATAISAAAAERRNWYHDPFFALSHAMAACPLPLGPLMTHAQMEDDAHYRVERGTTCWLAHKCTKPNSYLYDAPIADAIRAHFADPHGFDGTSLWITVQRRFVYVEGCVPAWFDLKGLRRQLEAVPDVEQVFIRVSHDPRGPLSYKTLAEPDKPVAASGAQ